MKILIIVIGVLLCLQSCVKSKTGYDIYKVPHVTFFLIKKNGQRLPDSTLDNMKMYYYKNSTKKYVDDFTRATNEDSFYARDAGIQGVRNVGFTSGAEGINDYYLEYPDNTIDTLFIDYDYLSEEQAYGDPCKCLYPFRAIKFNGQVPGIDSFYTFSRVYILNKR